MYEVIQTHESLPETDAAASLQLNTENSPVRLLSNDNTIRLNRREQDSQLSCETEISSVSVAADLVPNTREMWLGNIVAAAWMDAGAHDMQTMKNAIKRTGTPVSAPAAKQYPTTSSVAFMQ